MVQTWTTRVVIRGGGEAWPEPVSGKGAACLPLGPRRVRQGLGRHLPTTSGLSPEGQLWGGRWCWCWAGAGAGGVPFTSRPPAPGRGTCSLAPLTRLPRTCFLGKASFRKHLDCEWVCPPADGDTLNVQEHSQCGLRRGRRKQKHVSLPLSAIAGFERQCISSLRTARRISAGGNFV